MHAAEGGGTELLMVVKGAPDYGSQASITGFAEAAGVPKARIFSDAKQDVFKALGQTQRMSITAVASMTSLRRGSKSFEELKSQTNDGEGMVPGGGLMIDARGEVTYTWQELRGFGDRPPDEEIIAELKKIAGSTVEPVQRE